MDLQLHVEVADAVFRQAAEAGATVESPMADMDWGDRHGKVAQWRGAAPGGPT